MTNFSPKIEGALTTGHFSFSVDDFWQFWDEAGKPQEVEVTLGGARRSDPAALRFNGLPPNRQLDLPDAVPSAPRCSTADGLTMTYRLKRDPDDPFGTVTIKAAPSMMRAERIEFMVVKVAPR